MPHRRIVRQRRIATAIIAVSGLAVTAVGGWFVYSSHQRIRDEQIAAQIETAATAVKVALDQVALSVRAVRGLYAAGMVTQEEFVRFARPLAETEVLQAIGFLRRVDGEDRTSYEARLTQEPARSLGIWEYAASGERRRAGNRTDYFVVETTYLPQGSEPQYGFDAASEPTRAASIERSISQFTLVVSGAVPLLSTGRSGVVFYLPALDRSGDVIGVAFASATLDGLAAFARRTSGIFSIAVSVGSEPETAVSSSEPPRAASPVNQETFASGGQSWTVQLDARPTTGARLMWWSVALIVGAGVASTLALIGYVINKSKTDEIAEARAQLRGMLDGLGPLAWLLGPDGRVISANRTAVDAMRVREGDMLGRPFWALPIDYDLGGEPDRIRQAIATARTGEDARFDMIVEIAGEQRVLDLWVRPLAPRRSTSNNLVATAVDVTDRHEAQETQRMLMRELDHRMKNTLQVIQAIIRRTARTQGSITLFERSLLGRIQTMSRAHELLAGERWLGADIDTVIRQEAGSFDVGGVIRIGGPPLRLSPRAALSFALVIHELGTNASKYGALSQPSGRVEISWSVRKLKGELWLVLRWEESGGPPVEAPEARGFGSMLIERSIAYDLGGDARMEFRKEGLVCEVRAPLDTIRPFAMERSPERAAVA